MTPPGHSTHDESFVREDSFNAGSEGGDVAALTEARETAQELQVRVFTNYRLLIK